MNDLLSGTLDNLTPDDASLDLGSFDGFDPFAEEEPSADAPIAETEGTTESTATTETEENNVTLLPEAKETPLSPEPSAEPAAPAPRRSRPRPRPPSPRPTLSNRPLRRPR